VLISGNCTKWIELKNTVIRAPKNYQQTTCIYICFQLNFEGYEQYFERIKNELHILLEHIRIITPNTDILISKTEM
jgi:hypothetical protein